MLHLLRVWVGRNLTDALVYDRFPNSCVAFGSCLVWFALCFVWFGFGVVSFGFALDLVCCRYKLSVMPHVLPRTMFASSRGATISGPFPLNDGQCAGTYSFYEQTARCHYVAHST